MLRPTISKYSVSEIKSAFETIQAELGDAADPPPPGSSPCLGSSAKRLASALRVFDDASSKARSARAPEFASFSALPIAKTCSLAHA